MTPLPRALITKTTLEDTRVLGIFLVVLASVFAWVNPSIWNVSDVVPRVLLSLAIVVICFMILALAWNLYAALERRAASAARLTHYRLRNVLTEMHPRTFEQHIYEFFTSNGYEVDINFSNDAVIDAYVKRGAEQVAVQVKRYAFYRVHESEVRDFHKAFSASHTRGVMITTSDFTTEARRIAKNHSIELISGTELVSLLNLPALAPKGA